LNADILDEHYYKAPKWFLDNAKRYDNYDRKGPKIFAGEYARKVLPLAARIIKITGSAHYPKPRL
jgi:alpha-N-arabinofuranosidase